MKVLRSGLMAGVFLALWTATSSTALAATPAAGAADGPVDVLTYLSSAVLGAQLTASAANLNGSANLTEMAANSTTLHVPGWKFGSQSGGSLLIASTSPPVSGESPYAIEALYPVATTGAQYTWVNYSVAALDTEDVYIEFWAKMPDAKEGLKFLKIFGKRNDPEGFANFTVNPVYTGPNHGGFDNVEFGDGTTLVNDGQSAILFNGANPQWIGRSYGIATVDTPQMSFWSSSNWGVSWHYFRIHVKFNSGTTPANEVPNGEVYVEIDGKVYVDATGLYNRNPENGPINYIQFGGWAQTDPSPFQVWFDDIKISTGGFAPDAAPMPPQDVQVQ